MRILLVAPYPLDRVCGNSTTVSRIASGLRARGDVAVAACAVEDLDAAIARHRPTLLHAFHAGRVGPAVARAARERGLPLVITLTGTDVNEDLFAAGERRARTAAALEAAGGVIAFDAAVLARLAEGLGHAPARATAIAQAAFLPEPREAFDLRAACAVPADAILFLLPAGLRPVKAPHLAVEGIAPLAMGDAAGAGEPPVHLVLAGPVLDAAYAAPILERCARETWLAHAGAVPRARMAACYEAADVVLNTSESEGGMANAVLEAFAAGRPVIARDIPGNRSIVRDGENGLLFADAAALTAAARRIVADPALRERLARGAAASAAAATSVAQEAERHVAFYREVAAARGQQSSRVPKKASDHLSRRRLSP